MGLDTFGIEVDPMVVVLKQFNPAATAAADGYDENLREPKLVDLDGDGIGEEPPELYDDEIRVLAQIESSSMEALTMASGGDLPTSVVQASFSRDRLKLMSLIEADGKPKIKKGDRWVRMETEAGESMWTFDQPPAGLYCEEIRLSDAYLGGEANWFLATFKSRKEGPTS